MSNPEARRLEEAAVIVDRRRDNVAVAREALRAGDVLHSDLFGQLTLRGDVPAGHRFALRNLAAGEWVKQYGQPFA
jgi:altronate hydrolase